MATSTVCTAGTAADRASRGAADAGPYRGRGPKTWSRSDTRIREEVCERLLPGDGTKPIS